MTLAGHYWTIAPSLLHGWLPRPPPPWQPWSTVLDDPRVGAVALSGKLSARAHDCESACLIVVHGLGGSPDANYCERAAWAAERRSISCLRLSLRGADRKGEDFYHAGLAADLEAAVASQALAGFERLYVLGYSLGGHVSLRFALATGDRRVRAVAAVCAPLDLERSAQAIDRATAFIYRRHVLAGLKDIYRAVAARRSVPTPLARVLAARALREWDSLTVVPRFGFDSAEHYYTEMSVGPRLAELQVPSLLVQSLSDPMVPPWTYEPHLARPAPKLEVHRVPTGGHVGFPERVKLSDAAESALEPQLIDWLLQR
jgi:predicted alpha/beta-fold hydrolase